MAKFTVFVFLAIIPLISCFVRKRVVTLPGNRPSGPLLTATANNLIQRVHNIADPIQSFLMRMDMSPSAGSLYEGEIKDYATLGGFILFQKPDSIRIRGLDPVMHITVFDMVSAGDELRMYIPSKGQFIEGSNSAPVTSSNKLESLRPLAFLTSLMIYPPDPASDITLLEEDTTGGEATYILLFIRRDPNYGLARSLQFDRHNLQIVRQKTFDASGSVVSDTTYSGWRNYGRIPFPSVIDIKRPQDGYEVQLTVTSMKMNSADVTPEKFILKQPEGSELRQLSR
jgi:outer membrane lipoprotein-sorting protein